MSRLVDKSLLIVSAILFVMFTVVCFAAGNHARETQTIKRQAIEYGYAETNRLTGEWQWKEESK